MIQLNYTPTSIEDFREACKIIQEMGLGQQLPAKTRVVVAKAEPTKAIAKYCELKGNSKYYRTPHGAENGLTANEDLRYRAELGEAFAIEALKAEDEIDPEDIQADTDAPPDGRAY
jgi:hypothetical protein